MFKKTFVYFKRAVLDTAPIFLVGSVVGVSVYCSHRFLESNGVLAPFLAEALTISIGFGAIVFLGVMYDDK